MSRLISCAVLAAGMFQLIGCGGTAGDPCVSDRNCDPRNRCEALPNQSKKRCVPCDPEEIPYDGEDNDCDTRTLDFDLDGDGDNAKTARARPGTDCDDNDPRTSPAAVELCGDRKDNNCDGRVDEPECGDRDPPVVRFVSPAAMRAYAGTIEVEVEANDDTSIASIRLLGPGGQILGSTSNARATFMVDTVTLPEGPVTLQAEAEDIAERRSRASLSIRIDNQSPPEMVVLSPQDGTFYVGALRLEADAVDASDVRDVTISVDSDAPVVLTQPPYFRTVQTASLSEGLHQTTMVATDMLGNSVSRRTNFSVDRTPPRITVITPADGAQVNGTFDVIIEATDPGLGSGVKQIISTPGALGQRVTSDRRLRYSIDTVALGLPDGPFVIQTTAVDSAIAPMGTPQGNSAIREISVVIDNTNVTADAGVPFDAGDPPDGGADAGAADSGHRADAGALDSGTTTPLLEQIDVAPAGGEGCCDLIIAGISADGRRVGFIANGFYGPVYSKDLWVRERNLSETWTPPPYDNTTAQAVFSASGEAAAFVSHAPFEQRDTNGQDDVYVRHPDGRVSLASIRNDGTHFTEAVSVDVQAISADGRYVLFDSRVPLAANDTNADQDVYLRDTVLETTELVSLMADGSQPESATGFGVSDDGRYIVFLGSFDAAPGVPSTMGFIRDREHGTTIYMTRLPDLLMVGGGLISAVVAPDGRYVLYTYGSSPGGRVSGLYLYDVHADVTQELAPPFAINLIEGSRYVLNVSEDSRFLVFITKSSLVPDDTNNIADAYLWDRQLSNVARVSLSPTGGQIDYESSNPRISRDGTQILFQNTFSPFFNNNPNSFHFHIFKTPNPLWSETPDAGVGGDGGHPPDASPDAGVPDAGGADAGSVQWDVFDPNEVYIWGRGGSTRNPAALVHWARPRDVSVGFASDNAPASGDFIRADGRFVYAFGTRIGEFRCDPSQDCSAFSTQLRNRQLAVYPQSVGSNDLTISTSACRIQSGLVWGTPDGRAVFKCQTSDVYYDDTRALIDIPLEMDAVLAFGNQRAILGTSALSSDELVVTTPSHGPQSVMPRIGGRPLAVRSVSDGFLVVGTSVLSENELWKIESSTGLATLMGTYPPVLPGLSSPSSAALDAQGVFFQIWEETGVSSRNGVVLRRSLNGTSEVVYKARDHDVNTWTELKLVTGP